MVTRGEGRGGTTWRMVHGRVEPPCGGGWLYMRRLVWEWRKRHEVGRLWSPAGSHLWLPRERSQSII